MSTQSILLAKSNYTVVAWFAVMISLANCGGARDHNIGRTSAEIGDRVTIGPRVDLGLELGRNAVDAVGILAVPRVDFVKIERSDSSSNGGSDGRT